MADNPLFTLDAEARWRLAYDRNQWIVQRRDGPPRASEAPAGRNSGYRAVSFVGNSKRVLRRVLGENDVVLTPEAQAQLDALPEQFLDFVVAPVSFTVQLSEAA